jgi:uncharacterized integral membrane protein
MEKTLALSAFILIFGITAGIGFIFRVMHWPWGIQLIYAGVAGLVVCLVILFVRMNRKKNKDF